MQSKILAESTVKIHVQNMLRKLNLSSRVQAAVFAVENGLGRGPEGWSRQRVCSGLQRLQRNCGRGRGTHRRAAGPPRGGAVRSFAARALAFGGQVHLDRAPILATRTALDQSEFLATRNRATPLHAGGPAGARRLADAGPFASGIALDLEQQQVLEVGDAVAPGEQLGEAQEAPQLVAEVGEASNSDLSSGVFIVRGF